MSSTENGASDAPETSQTSSPDQGSENGSASSPVADLQRQVEEKESKYRYLYADFENFKRRVAKERQDLIKFAGEPMARELLGVADNLERALQHAAPGTDRSLLQGLEMTLKQFRDVLQKFGVQVIQSGNGEFDPNLHEAVAHIPSDKHPAGAIMSEETRGYTLHGRLLRPARVVVSAGASENRG